MVGVLDQGMHSEVIKLSRSANWIWPYGPYIRYAFGLLPIPSDPLGAYHVLTARFSRMTPEDKDIIYLWECLAEYSIIAKDYLLELGIPNSQVMNLWHRWIRNLASVEPEAILDLTIDSVSAMQGYFDAYIHDEDTSPSVLEMVETRQRKGFTSFFNAVIKLRESDEVVDEVQIVLILRELSEYLGRVKSESRVETLQKKDLKKYLDQERDMGNWDYDPEILSRLRKIISEWYPEQLWTAEMEHFSPVLSSGSPYGSTRRAGGSGYYKYNMFAKNKKVLDWQSKYNIFDGIPNFDLKAVEADDEDQENRKMPAHNPSIQLAGNRSFVCELVYVPKTAKKLRTISKEPPYLSYLQHGVQHAMVRIGRKTKLHAHVDYARADLSAELAKYGSLNGFYDTLDLSAASDSVHLSLVDGAFPEYMLAALIATRSDYVQLPNKEIIYMNKFAPMGSATCFPVETTLFSAVCELAKQMVGLPEAQYRVYGDDIVCDHRLTATIIHILTLLHFKVNKLKSFTGFTSHTFREACGGEFCNGFDVKPLRVSRQRYSVFAMSSEVARESYIDMMHECWIPFRNIARLLYQRMDSLVIDFKEIEYDRVIDRRFTRMSCGLPWSHIKEHPVYNPARSSISEPADFSRLNTVKYNDNGDDEITTSTLVELGSFEAHSGYMRPWGADSFGYKNKGYVSPTTGTPMMVDSGLAALWTWLAKAERRPQVDECEYRAISLPFLYELELCELDDEFSEPLSAKAYYEVAVFAPKRRNAGREVKINKKDN